MPNDPRYDAVLSIAKVHLAQAFEAFRTDGQIPWRDLEGNVPKVRAQVWVDALKDALQHHQQIEGLLS
jgi:hypothetical protein